MIVSKYKHSFKNSVTPVWTRVLVQGFNLVQRITQLQRDDRPHVALRGWRSSSVGHPGWLVAMARMLSFGDKSET
jgi:hypothetical protein